jgi:hypothetical protein
MANAGYGSRHDAVGALRVAHRTPTMIPRILLTADPADALVDRFPLIAHLSTDFHSPVHGTRFLLTRLHS